MNEALSYGLLFRAASQTLLQLAREKKYLHAQAGMMGVLHTWGQTLSYHPHLHCLVPAGGLSLDGKRWVHSRKRFFLPVKVLSRLFRGKFLAALKQAFSQGKLQTPAQAGFSSMPQFNAYLRPLYRKEWGVYAKAPFGGPKQVIQYLGRYTHRVAISNDRILGLEDGKVRFQYKDYNNGNKRKIMQLDAQEFIRRFMMHILPPGFHKIRYYGILATRNRGTKLAQARKVLGQKPIQKPPRRSWQQMLLQLTGTDPRHCPKCKKGHMNTIQTLSPSRAPPPLINLPQLSTPSSCDR